MHTNCSVDLVAVRLFASLLAAPNRSHYQWVHGQSPSSRNQYFLHQHCCHPHVPATYTCPNLSVIGGDWPICPSYSPRGLVYSVGIDNIWDFDDACASSGHEVHSFDPTAKNLAMHQSHKQTGVHFHPWGLTGGDEIPCVRDPQQPRKKHELQDAGGRGSFLDSLYTLTSIRERLGHSSRRISMLKIDCEGCEWDVFHHLSQQPTSLLDDVDVLLIELHPNLLLTTDADLNKFGSFFEYVFIRSGFRIWWQHPNGGGKDRPCGGGGRCFHPVLLALGLDPHICCYELALVRPTGTAAEMRESQGILRMAYAREAVATRATTYSPCPHCLGNR